MTAAPVRPGSRLVLITMSRDWLADECGNPHHAELAEQRRDTTIEALALIHGEWPDAILVHGDAEQGDRQAGELWVEMCGGDVSRELPMPAQWPLCVPSCPPGHRRWLAGGRSYCPKAGHRRNTRMVEWVAQQRRGGAVAVCVAFVLNGSAGATHCLDEMRRLDLPVHAIHAAAPRHLKGPKKSQTRTAPSGAPREGGQDGQIDGVGRWVAAATDGSLGASGDGEPAGQLQLG